MVSPSSPFDKLRVTRTCHGELVEPQGDKEVRGMAKTRVEAVEALFHHFDT